MISILAEYGIGWGVYAYTGRWETVRKKGEADEELARILIPQGSAS